MRNELTLAQKGDAQALNRLINEHRDLAYSIALKLLKNKPDAEDIVQESFVIVLRSIDKFRNESKFSTWLYKIVYRECLREIRQKAKNPEYAIQASEIPETADSDDTNPIDVDFSTLLGTLKPNEYTVVSLFYLKEKRIQDIMKITSLSKSNVKVLLHRARQKMQLAAQDQQQTN